VRKGGLEPPRSCDRQPLKLVRLPIPPLSRGGAASRLRNYRSPKGLRDKRDELTSSVFRAPVFEGPVPFPPESAAPVSVTSARAFALRVPALAERVT
jgi:hypothetical protein